MPFEVGVCIRAPGRLLHATALDISLSGLFVRSEELFPVGTICDIEVEISSEDQQFDIRDRFQVVRRVEGGQGVVRGMGFAFVGEESE